MLAADFTRKIDVIDKVLSIVETTNISSLAEELDGYETKVFDLILKLAGDSDTDKDINALIEIKELNPVVSDSNLFKKYYRSLVRANANLESLLPTIDKKDLESLEIPKTAELYKQIEDFMFNMEDETDPTKSFKQLKELMGRHNKLHEKFALVKDVYGSLSGSTAIPENYRDFEITFFTEDESLEDFNSRVLSFKLLYEIIMRLNGIPENDGNRLLLLRAEKEKAEHFRVGGISNILSDMYFLIKEWAKEFSTGNISDDKEVFKLKNVKILEAKIKGLIDKNQIDSATGEKYSEIIKKSLRNFQIDKCNSIELSSESINSTTLKVPSVQIKREMPHIPRMPMGVDNTFQDTREAVESVELRKIESSILLKSTNPPRSGQSAEEMLEKGINLMSIKRYTDALAYFNKALELRPNYAEGYNFKGNAYIQMGQFREALELVNSAIALKPDYKEAYLNKGTILFSLNKYAEAVEQYKKTIELDSNYAEGYFNLGSCYMMLDGKRKEAIDAFSKAISITPAYAAAYYNRACAYISEKEVDNCLNDLSWAVKLDKKFKDMLKFDTDFSEIHSNSKFKSLIL